MNLELFAQYGIAGIAVYLFYKIVQNHIKGINRRLDRVIELLEEIKGKLK